MGSRICFFTSFREKKGVKDSAGIDTTLKMELLVPGEQGQLQNPLTAPQAGQCESSDSELPGAFQGALEVASPETGLSQASLTDYRSQERDVGIGQEQAESITLGQASHPLWQLSSYPKLKLNQLYRRCHWSHPSRA